MKNNRDEEWRQWKIDSCTWRPNSLCIIINNVTPDAQPNLESATIEIQKYSSKTERRDGGEKTQSNA